MTDEQWEKELRAVVGRLAALGREVPEKFSKEHVLRLFLRALEGLPSPEDLRNAPIFRYPPEPAEPSADETIDLLRHWNGPRRPDDPVCQYVDAAGRRCRLHIAHDGGHRPV